jgi:hypothetical protein
MGSQKVPFRGDQAVWEPGNCFGDMSLLISAVSVLPDVTLCYTAFHRKRPLFQWEHAAGIAQGKLDQKMCRRAAISVIWG